MTGRVSLAVGCGAALGSVLRYLVGVAVVAAGWPTFIATGLVNLLGSFVIGFVATISGPDGRLLVGPAARQLVMAGLCGGLTTFSTMSLDAFRMLAEHRLAAALLYLAAVVLGSVGAAFLGHLLAARLNR